MIFTKLAGAVTQGLEQVGDGRIFGRDAVLVPGHADGQKTGPEGMLTQNERGASSGAALLSISIAEDGALVRDAIDVGRTAAHHAAVVGAHVPVANIIAKDDQDVGLLARGLFDRNERLHVL